MVTRARRGFTLLEAMVGGAIAAIVLSGALAVFLAGHRVHRRQLDVAQLKRSSQLVLSQLVSELRQSGLGVPTRLRADGAGEAFPFHVLVAEANQVVFMADLPRSDSNFHGVSRYSDDQVTDLPAGPALAVVNELSGPCDVELGATPSCLTNATSNLFTGGTDCASNPSAATCPWGLKKYVPNEYLLLTDAMGNWVERRAAAVLNADSGTRRLLKLTAAPPAGLFTSPNRGYVSTPDRVFWRLNAGKVERNQCWGTVNSPVANLSTACANGADGTGWQTLATMAATPGLVFSYLDATGATVAAPVAAADLRRIRRVVVNLHLERQSVGGLVTSDTRAEVSFRQ